MKYARNRHLIFIMICLLFTNCKKEEKLEGDYIVCKINGKAWRAGCNDFGGCKRADVSEQKKVFIMEGSNTLNQAVSIIIYDSIRSFKSGEYILNQNSQFNCGKYVDYGKSFTYKYNTNPAYTGTLSVTFDEEKKRVSGTFSFEAKYDTGNAMVHITDGKFSMPCLIL